MGIGCRLRGAEAANRAQDDVQLAVADGVLAVSLQFMRRLDDSRELRLFDSRHKGSEGGGYKPSKRGAELEGKTAWFPQEVSKVAQ